MDDREISPKLLARGSEISEARIDRFLTAEVEPAAGDLLRLASVLDVSVSQLLERIGWESDGHGGGSIVVEDPGRG